MYAVVELSGLDEPFLAPGALRQSRVLHGVPIDVWVLRVVSDGLGLFGVLCHAADGVDSAAEVHVPGATRLRSRRDAPEGWGLPHAVHALTLALTLGEPAPPCRWVWAWVASWPPRCPCRRGWRWCALALATLIIEGALSLKVRSSTLPAWAALSRAALASAFALLALALALVGWAGELRRLGVTRHGLAGPLPLCGD